MEEMAEINLNNQKIEHFLPRFTCGKRKGKVIFPGYIFIKPKTGDTFQSIRSTRGVSDFVRFEMAFANVSDETIDDLKKVVDVMNDRMDQTKRIKSLTPLVDRMDWKVSPVLGLIKI